MSQTITPELVSLDTPLGADKAAVIRALAARVAEQGRATDPEALFADAWAREQKDETGLPGGIAIPHAKSSAVVTPSLAFARLKPGVDFGASDGPADLVFLIAAPEGAAEAHLAVLSKLARSLMQDDFTAGLRAATSADEVVAIVRNAIGEGDAAPAAAPAAAAAAPTTAAVADGLSVEGRPARIVAVTACATGIAHTFMAADALTAAGKKAGIDLVVEPQGSSGYKALPNSTIDNADAVIFATDVDVREPGRFAGKPVIRSGVKRGIEQPDQMIREAVAAANDPSSARVSGTATAATATAATQLSMGCADPADPAHRRELHDPVRRRWRSADRDRLRPRRLRSGRRSRHGHHRQRALGSARRRARPVPRLGRVHHRRHVDGLPGLGSVRLHRVRDRRSSRNRPRIRGRCRRGAHERRLHRRHRRRSARRCRGLVARAPARTALAARTHAGRDHPAASARSSLRVC